MSIAAHRAPAVNPDIATLADLEAQLRREGYVEGIADHIGEQARRADAYQFSWMRCPGCGRRSMALKSFCRGRAYRLLAYCTECAATEEC
jgi:hypothetical protein